MGFRISFVFPSRPVHWIDAMSALPPKADIAGRQFDVRFVPKADILRCGKERRYSITSSALASSDCGTSAMNARRLIRSPRRRAGVLLLTA
jgi:hypothetical protein